MIDKVMLRTYVLARMETLAEAAADAPEHPLPVELTPGDSDLGAS